MFKGPDAAGRLPGFIPPGEGRRASRCSVTLVARSTRYALTRVPRLARPAPLARPRGGFDRHSESAVQQATAASWEVAGKAVPAKLHEQATRYVEEQAEIKKTAQEKEKERDEKSAEADHLLHRHHRFANAVALFQVSIALGALAALTRNRTAWWGSMLLGLSGIPLFVWAFLS